jgi:hypothetical protein
MQELTEQLSEKAGIDRGTAEKVAATLHEQAANLPNLLHGDSQGLTQLLAGLGIDEATVQKVLAFLKEHADQLPAWLGSEGGGIGKMARDLLGGILGKKEGS